MRTTVSLLGQFVRLNVEMDVNLRSGDYFFLMDLQFAMQTFNKGSSNADILEPSSPTSPKALSLSRRSESFRSHEV